MMRHLHHLPNDAGLLDHELDAARAYVIDGTHPIGHVVEVCGSLVRALRAIDLVRYALVVARAS